MLESLFQSFPSGTTNGSTQATLSLTAEATWVDGNLKKKMKKREATR